MDGNTAIKTTVDCPFWGDFPDDSNWYRQVKGINVLFPEISADDAAYKYKVKSVSDKKLVLNDGRADYELKIGDKLPADFEGGLTYEGKKVLSNDLELSEGMVLIPKLFSCSYQELLLY